MNIVNLDLSNDEKTLRAIFDDPEVDLDEWPTDPSEQSVEQRTATLAAAEILGTIYAEPADPSDSMIRLSTTYQKIRQLSQENPSIAINWELSLASIYHELRFRKLTRGLEEHLRSLPSIPSEWEKQLQVATPFCPDARKQFFQEAATLLDDMPLPQPGVERTRGSTLLFLLAAEVNYWEGMNVMMDADVDPNAQNSNGETALHIAATKNQREAIHTLIVKRADLNMKDGLGRTALHFASSRNHQEAIVILTAAGANPNIPNNEGLTPLHFADWNDPETLRALLLAGADLHTLLEAGADLHLLIFAGADLHALIEAGADLNQKDHQDRTPLHISVARGNLELTRSLIEAGVNLDAKDHEGQTALNWSIRRNNLEIIGLLVAAGADLNTKNHEGQTALHLAIRWNNPETTRLLIDTGRGDPSIQDNEGESSLHLAVCWNNPEAICAFALTGDLNATNNKGRTALHIAVAQGDLDTIDILLAQGANPYMQDNEGRTPIDFATDEQIDEINERIRLSQRRFGS